MQISEFVALLKMVDPTISKNKGNGHENYTVWTIGKPAEKLMSDDQEEDRVNRIYVDRFTKDAEDRIPSALESALDAAFISYDAVQDYEEDTKYHHHSYTCYV